MRGYDWDDSPYQFVRDFFDGITELVKTVVADEVARDRVVTPYPTEGG